MPVCYLVSILFGNVLHFLKALRCNITTIMGQGQGGGGGGG
jgi:hypothetical protein